MCGTSLVTQSGSISSSKLCGNRVNSDVLSVQMEEILSKHMNCGCFTCLVYTSIFFTVTTCKMAVRHVRAAGGGWRVEGARRAETRPQNSCSTIVVLL